MSGAGGLLSLAGRLGDPVFSVRLVKKPLVASSNGQNRLLPAVCGEQHQPETGGALQISERGIVYKGMDMVLMDKRLMLTPEYSVSHQSGLACHCRSEAK